jgi:TonB family protein
MRVKPIAVILAVANLALLVAAHLHAQQTSEDIQKQRYTRILKSSTLQWLYSEPYTLKADFQSYDLEGKPSEPGTMEQTWGNEIPMDLELFYLGKRALTAHVTELDALSPQSEKKSSQATTERQVIPSAIMSGRILKKENPKYPFSAKMKKIEGSVLVIAVIDKQGKMADMDVIASPDPLLTKSTQDAVRKWTYEPYLQNGIPLEVETTIMVNYNLNLNHD